MIELITEKDGYCVHIQGPHDEVLTELNAIVKAFVRTESLKKDSIKVMTAAIVDASHDDVTDEVEVEGCITCRHDDTDLNEYPCNVCTKNMAVKTFLDSRFKDMWEEGNV